MNKEEIIQDIYTAEDYFLLRAPDKPLEFIDSDFLNSSLDIIKFCKNDKFFLQKIHISSPELYKSLINLDLDNINTSKKKQKKVKQIASSLLKYLLRSSSRPTPFGVFRNPKLTQIAT
ncbi:lantibiotic dehydratase [Alkalibacillus silvisoli]|uniref:Lantibiotic dehydratase N-terminal domain-containing protein n=1 Tax=Alkalibacillus silvisoli TaxID=392823 RepID=A0ABN0ZXZ0_9BACI